MPFSFLRRAGRAPEQKASAAPLMAVYGTGRAVWTPRDQASMARSGYEQNAIGFRAVRLVAEACAAVPLVLEEGGQLVVPVNDESSQVIKLPGVTNISDLVFEDPCAFWVLNCTNREEGAYSLIKFVI